MSQLPTKARWDESRTLICMQCTAESASLSLEHRSVYKEIQAALSGGADTVPLQNSHQQTTQELNPGQRSLRIWSEPRKRGLDLSISECHSLVSVLNAAYLLVYILDIFSCGTVKVFKFAKLYRIRKLFRVQF